MTVAPDCGVQSRLYDPRRISVTLAEYRERLERRIAEAERRGGRKRGETLARPSAPPGRPRRPQNPLVDR